MQYALDRSGVRIEANRGTYGICPGCQMSLIPKCGVVKAHHWAHIGGQCDPWWEPESPWHRKWKTYFQPQCREVVMLNHRADIRRPDGVVLELQHSPISAEEIRAREVFYNHMVWIVDGTRFAGRFELRGPGRTALPEGHQGYATFRWKHPAISWAHATRPVFIDLGDLVFEIQKMGTSCPLGGWGWLASKENALRQFIGA